MTTNNFGLNTPTFGSANWHTPINQNFDIIDNLLSGTVSGTGGTPAGQWANSTAYGVNDIAVDTDGSLWKCLVLHTSTASPTTFSGDRTTYPTYWEALTTLLNSGENLKYRRGVSAQSSTTFALDSILTDNYYNRITGTYVSTAGSPGVFSMAFTESGTPATDTYYYSYYQLGTGAGSGATTASNYAPLSVAMIADEPIVFDLQIHRTSLYGTNYCACRYFVAHYDGSALCTSEGYIRVGAGSIDGIDLYNTGTTITAGANIFLSPGN